jgi:hypothetical protein
MKEASASFLGTRELRRSYERGSHGIQLNQISFSERTFFDD